MNTKDAVYYVGLMGGLIVGTLVLRSLGVGGILQFAGGIVVGVGCGYLAERAYSGPKPPKRADFEPQDSLGPPRNPGLLLRSCPNPGCNWSGTRRDARYCPKCGSPLP